MKNASMIYIFDLIPVQIYSYYGLSSYKKVNVS